MNTYRFEGRKLVKVEATPKVFALVVNNNGKSIDQMVTTLRIAEREKRDLIKLDCGSVSIVALEDWASADAYEAHVRGY